MMEKAPRQRNIGAVGVPARAVTGTAYLALVILGLTGSGCATLSPKHFFRVHHTQQGVAAYKVAHYDPTGSGEWLTTFDQAKGKEGFAVAMADNGLKRSIPLAEICRVEEVTKGNKAGMYTGATLAAIGVFPLVGGGLAMISEDYRAKVGNTGWIILGAGAGLVLVGNILFYVSRAIESPRTVYEGQCGGGQ